MRIIYPSLGDRSSRRVVFEVRYSHAFFGEAIRALVQFYEAHDRRLRSAEPLGKQKRG